MLGDPTRLQLLQALRSGERRVSELVAIVGAPQSRVSNHLACLKWCRLVTAERRGRSVVYRLAADVDPLLAAGGSLASAHEEYLASCTRIGPDWV